MDMENGLWFNENWMTSPLNFLPEVRAGMEFPKRLKFHDAMLRDGEQTPGVVLKPEHKLAIAKALDEVGVDRIEAGMPAVSEDDYEAVKLINKANLKARISGFVRAMDKDIDLCLKAGVTHIVIEIPCGYLRLKYQMGWTQDECIRRAVAAVGYAKKQGLEVCFFPFDATRADFEFYLRLQKTVYEECGPDSVTVVDTMGTTIPQALAYMVRRVRSVVPVPIEVHTHNDFGMGVASTLAAITAGAEVAHVCINGMGERTGNAALEEVDHVRDERGAELREDPRGFGSGAGVERSEAGQTEAGGRGQRLCARSGPRHGHGEEAATDGVPGSTLLRRPHPAGGAGQEERHTVDWYEAGGMGQDGHRGADAGDGGPG
jgi:hypothetical protein